MKLASFDIFDTTLIRKCGQPENIFYLLARRLYPQDRALREDFLVWRRHIGGRVKLPGGKTEAGLADFYRSAEFPGYTAEEIAEAEKAVEAENLIANPAIREEIERCRKEGYTIAFISDMYLPGDFLGDVLLREGCRRQGETVFVSCEHQARKDRGTLYELVRRRLQPTQWLHYGDHPRSDVKMAQRHHIRAKLIHTAYTPIEQEMMRIAAMQQDHIPLSILAGISRAARIMEGNPPEAVLAADFVAPGYLPYVQYALQSAKKRNLKRLYFLSRDGFMLYRAAQAASPEVEVRELFVSRRSLTLPYLADDFSEQAYLLIVDRHTLLRKPVAGLLRQLGLSREELQDEYGISFDYGRINSAGQERDFLDKLFHSPFSAILKERALAARELVLEYFRQEGVTNGSPPLLVDVGWLGSSRLMINSLLKHADCPEAEFLYFGLRSDVFSCRFGRYEAYFREGRLSTESTVLIENYFSLSPNPSTHAYRMEAGKIVPVWEAGKEIRETPLVKLHVRMMEWMMRTLSICPFSPETLYLWAKLSVDAITRLEGKPDLRPLMQCGEFDSCDFVRKLTLPELFRIACGGRVTAFDPASVQLTAGERGRKSIMSLHRTAIRYVYPLYRKFF